MPASMFSKNIQKIMPRNTGIPTIQRELAHNGSPAATFETDEDCLSTVKRHLQKLKELGFIEREGSDKAGKWVILK